MGFRPTVARALSPRPASLHGVLAHLGLHPALCSEPAPDKVMGAYERLVAEDDDSHDGKLVDAQHRAKRRRLVREKLERLLWILASVALVSFGDGAYNLVTLVLHRYNEARSVSACFLNVHLHLC